MQKNTLTSRCALCLVTLLVACSNLSNVSNLSNPSGEPVVAQTPIQPPLRQYYRQINMSGRLSAQYEASNKPQSAHVHFNWAQTAHETVVTLSSPTGQTLATLTLNENGAHLNRSGRPPQFASDVNQLLFASLGWPLPVAGLKDWLQGFTNAEHNVAITPSSSVSAFSIDGWKLHFVTWESEKSGENVGQNKDRPKRIDLTRQTAEAGMVSLRIVIDDWNGQ